MPARQVPGGWTAKHWAMSDTMVLEQSRIRGRGEDDLVRLRFVAVVGIVLLNAVDLLLTRYLLQRGAVEANPLMVLVIGGGWGVAIKLGIPILAGFRHLTAPLIRRAVLALCWVNVLYVAVVAWNVHVLVSRVG